MPATEHISYSTIKVYKSWSTNKKDKPTKALWQPPAWLRPLHQTCRCLSRPPSGPSAAQRAGCIARLGVWDFCGFFGGLGALLPHPPVCRLRSVLLVSFSETTLPCQKKMKDCLPQVSWWHRTAWQHPSSSWCPGCRPWSPWGEQRVHRFWAPTYQSTPFKRVAGRNSLKSTLNDCSSHAKFSQKPSKTSRFPCISRTPSQIQHFPLPFPLNPPKLKLKPRHQPSKPSDIARPKIRWSPPQSSGPSKISTNSELSSFRISGAPTRVDRTWAKQKRRRWLGPVAWCFLMFFLVPNLFGQRSEGLLEVSLF